SRPAAEQLLRSLARAFPRFWEWSQHVVDMAMLTGQLRSVFGWPLCVGADARPTALRNYPMQANGAEMLRVACCLATERGVTVCPPVHDELLVDAPIAGLPEITATTRTAMAEAARAVLGGMELRTDMTVVTWPHRYADARGAVMWQRVNALVNRYT